MKHRIKCLLLRADYKPRAFNVFTMLPIVFRYGNFTLYTYGIFVALAFFWFLYISWKLLRITSHKEDELFDKIFLAMGIGLIAGRVAYMAFHFDIIMKKGFLAALAVHLYPGFHGFTVIFVAILALIAIIRNKKFSGSELVIYILPAICVAMAIINIGTIFSGGIVGTQTDFPIRVKYALYDGLRHVPTLYRALAFTVMAYFYYKMIFWARQHKVEYPVVISSFLWIFAMINTITIPIHDALTYGTSPGYRLYDIYASVFLLLTAFGSLMYHWRSYFFGFIKVGKKGTN